MSRRTLSLILFLLGGALGIVGTVTLGQQGPGWLLLTLGVGAIIGGLLLRLP